MITPPAHPRSGVVRRERAFALAACALLAACSKSSAPSNTALTPATHTAFSIMAGGHAVTTGGAVTCNTCHGDASSFKQFTCTGCHAHDQAPTDTLHARASAHLQTPAQAAFTYSWDSAACFSCHPGADGTRKPAAFSHDGVASNCNLCHAEGASFAALPPDPLPSPGFVHQPIGSNDCVACHTSTPKWQGTTMPTGLVADAAANVPVTGLVPSWAATKIASVSPLAQSLPMQMLHSSKQVADGAFSSCTNCHSNSASGTYTGGLLHASLTGLGLPAPAGCSDCHAAAAPSGFVGPLATAPARVPASGEMRHEAVAWSGSAPGTAKLVTGDCSVCHLAPSAAAPQAKWSTGPAGSANAQFHLSLGAGGQPASCLDCHANSRPAALLTAANAALPAGLQFDHGAAAALADCTACHTGTTLWTGGHFHTATAAAPATCLPCHEGERPVTTAGWKAGYQTKPFDFTGSTQGTATFTHGAGLDCISCHAATNGAAQTWQTGSFVHGPATLSARTCLACHTTQRPDVAVSPDPIKALLPGPNGWDHAVSGTGDCVGCHQATVKAGSYAAYFGPGGVLPGGDWKGGIGYPGSELISSSKSVTVAEIVLNRTGALVTGTTLTSGTFFNQMLHDSAQVPAAVNAGSTQSGGDYTKCWHCHATQAGTTTVTNYADGVFHPALTNFTATPGGTVTPIAQPTQCLDCHQQMAPSGIVQKLASVLQPMDHAATFSAPAVVGGVSVSGVAGVDCVVCHKTSPGGDWTDGVFHKSIGSAQPADCTACHYTLMADPRSDVTKGTSFTMRHSSGQLTSQACQQCHTGALAAVVSAAPTASTPPTTTALWQTGAFHASVAAQPAACLECHAVSTPATTTQGTVSYAFSPGGTATNAGQWMNHASALVKALDCSKCHAADAAAATAWSKSAPFHKNVPSAASCQECHGLGNGLAAANNNLPSGLSNSTVLTTAGNDPTTGISPTLHDQLSHADPSVTGKDCKACHTQQGPATPPGQEWAKALLHPNAAPATCTGCHYSLLPASTFTQFNHQTLKVASGPVVAPDGTHLSTDCAGCHLKNIGTNWTGAVGAGPHTLSFLQTSSCVSCHVKAGPATNPGGTVTTGIAVGMPAGSIAINNNNGLQFVHVDPNGKFDFSTTSCLVCHANAANSVLVPAGGTNIINAVFNFPWALGTMGTYKTAVALSNATTQGTDGTTAGGTHVLPTSFTYNGSLSTGTGGTTINTCFPCHATDTKGLNKHCRSGQTKMLTDCVQCHKKPPSWDDSGNGNPTCQ